MSINEISIYKEEVIVMGYFDEEDIGADTISLSKIIDEEDKNLIKTMIYEKFGDGAEDMIDIGKDEAYKNKLIAPKNMLAIHYVFSGDNDYFRMILEYRDGSEKEASLNKKELHKFYDNEKLYYLMGYGFSLIHKI